MLVTRQDAMTGPASVATALPTATIPAESMPVASKAPGSGGSSAVGIATQPLHTHALAVAADVDGLSDGNLVQLMSDMNRFDALPATESDPVISVDSGY
jgi:hypothetical protein